MWDQSFRPHEAEAALKTQCTGEPLEFHALGRRLVTGRFEGGRISSDAGGVLLRERDKRIGLSARVSRGWVDYRNPASLEHSVHEWISQRLYAIALGYEDLNDPDELRCDGREADWRARARLCMGQCESVEPHGTRRSGGGGARALQAPRRAPARIR
ncbi:MAG: hypothetical protein GKR94_05680 [Gammaproteobacteria bacterium]|nr:hypothetical protein [Gammaproteobacteria bacterium]